MPSLGTWLDKTLGVASVRPMLFGFPCTMPLPGLRSAEILDLASFRLRSRSSRTNRCAPLKYLNLYLVFNNRWWSQTNASLTMRGRLALANYAGLEWTCLDNCSLLARFFDLQQIQKLVWLRLSGTPIMITFREQSIGLVLTLAPKPVDNLVEAKAGPLE